MIESSLFNPEDPSHLEASERAEARTTNMFAPVRSAGFSLACQIVPRPLLESEENCQPEGKQINIRASVWLMESAVGEVEKLIFEKRRDLPAPEIMHAHTALGLKLVVCG